jgi:hypothetical protein
MPNCKKPPWIDDTPRYTPRSGRYDGHFGLYHDYGPTKHDIVSKRALACLVGCLIGLAVLVWSLFG